MKEAVSVSPVGRPLTGHISPPGSKSITNRALLLAALAGGRSRLTGILRSDDTRYMIQALGMMGVDIRDADESSLEVNSAGRLRRPPAPLFVGNAGTAMRFLTAAAALGDGEIVVDGDERMRKRPIGALVAALRLLGVQVRDSGGCPPVVVDGTGARLGGRTEIDGSLSSQFVSALLMISPCGHLPIEVGLANGDIGALGYVDLTLATMRRFGVDLEKTDPSTWRAEPTGYQCADVRVEPDASACTYLWAAAALTGGRIDVGVVASELSQPDAAALPFISAFPRMPVRIDGSQMQDAVPTLAVMAAFNSEPVRFVGIANLRVKECDRIRALATELARISPGLAREEGDDLIVDPNRLLVQPRRPIRIETYADHRIAMSFALAGLRIPGIEVLNPGCVVKTYPAFWRDLARVGVDVR